MEQVFAVNRLSYNVFDLSDIIQFISISAFPLTSSENALLGAIYSIIGPSIALFLLIIIPKLASPIIMKPAASFAVGALLGDVFLHMLPECFENSNNNGENNYNQGLIILIGFLIFSIISGEGHNHNHNHDHGEHNHKGHSHHNNLALISDFAHNVTDGLALSGAFATSHSVGVSTAIATLLHSIPHSVGDYALRVQSGNGKFKSIFFTLLASSGVLIGSLSSNLLTNESNNHNHSHSHSHTHTHTHSHNHNTLLSSLTAGALLFMATSSLRESEISLKNKSSLAALLSGIIIMSVLSH